mmetsp:Transcript_6521/g.14089  ORF Transcript_6521/g.14089 Transcript_6521/m.14089 type:complete len:183 (-) Transcript_6521:262-810(-)
MSSILHARPPVNFVTTAVWMICGRQRPGFGSLFYFVAKRPVTIRELQPVPFQKILFPNMSCRCSSILLAAVVWSSILQLRGDYLPLMATDSRTIGSVGCVNADLKLVDLWLSMLLRVGIDEFSCFLKVYGFVLQITSTYIFLCVLCSTTASICNLFQNIIIHEVYRLAYHEYFLVFQELSLI